MGDYEIVLADLGWAGYTPCGTAEIPYRCMTEEECMTFDWSRWMGPRCVIFAWVTCPKLDLQFRCVEEWKRRHGLRYIGVPYVWVKTTKAGKPIGASGPRPTLVKPLTEFVIALTNVKRGRPFPLLTEAQSQWCHVEDAFGEPHEITRPKARLHSRKPAIVRDRIVELFGPRKRIELFARERVEGWDGWGDEYPTGATRASA